MLRATVLGDIDGYVVKPGTPPDEHFHRFVTEQLDEWGRSNLPGLEVVRVIGEEWAARSHELRELLGRNGIPFGFYSAGSLDGQRVLEEAGATGKALPAVVLFDGRILADPSNTEVGEALGVQTKPGGGCYDVTVIGAGPAGLAAAVYGASEGLSTVVLEPEAIGGQAGTSSLIRNYLGFPTGVSGGDLAVRAYTQASNFGAEYVYGNPATGLRPEGSELVVTVADGSEVRSRAVIVATGMAYRRLGIPALDALTGAGVFYGAAASEAKAMKDSEVFVVGGANSAGQAAVHLARYAAQVTVLVRGRSLADSMSEYLIREIESAPNIAVRCGVAVTGGAGQSRLDHLTLTDVCDAASERGLRPVVLNADSRQVYVGMDIGTSKIKPSQMRGFEHRLLDLAEPSSKLSLEAYAQMARDELASLAASGNALPVLVGGTGVYVQSVLDGWDLTGTGTLRRSLERDFPRGDVEGAYHVLARLAPEVARRVHPGNYEAILNTLVRRMAGHAGSKVAMPFAFAVYGLDRGKAETDRRIEMTLDAQIRDGLLAEIAELDRRYRLVEQARRPGAGATWHCRRMGIASSSAWPRRPGRQSPNSTAPALPPPEPKHSATSGRTPDANGRGSANLARRGSTIDQR